MGVSLRRASLPRPRPPRKALRARGAVTTILIAQRISSVRHADLILVFADGRVIGAGKHDELLETCAEYRLIAESQMGTGEEADA